MRQGGNISLPPQFQEVEKNYLRVQDPSNGGQIVVSQHTPAHSYQYVGQQAAPPPPVKFVQQSGCPPASGAVRQLFQPPFHHYAPQIQQLPAYYMPQQMSQQGVSFAAPPPPLQPNATTVAGSGGLHGQVSTSPAVAATSSGPGPSVSGSGGGAGQ